MTVAMSDRDYAVLADAAGWVKLHAGDDAPEYLELGILCRVVDGIGRRRVMPSEGVPVDETRVRRPHHVLDVFDLRDMEPSHRLGD